MNDFNQGWDPIRLSAIHQRHVDLGATIVTQSGWQLPSYYTEVDQETKLIMDGVGICDISPVGKLLLQGKELSAVLAPIEALPVGRVIQHDLVGTAGTSLGNLLLCRMTEEQVFVITPMSKVEQTVDILETCLGGCAHVVQMTSGLAGMSLVGPASTDVLAKLSELDLSAQTFPDYSCAWAGMALTHTLVVRTDLGQQTCYQIFVPRDLGEFVWDALMVAGYQLGIVPCGFESLRSLGWEG